MPERQLLITGTGRAGTTALVELLDALGLETKKNALRYYEGAHAGYETTLSAPDAPYVVKLPQIDLAAEIADGYDPSRLDGIIVPIRDLDQAILSRKQQSASSDQERPPGGIGGRWPWQARRAVLERFYQLLLTAAEHAIPVHLVEYPRFALDWEYAHKALRSLVDVPADEFREAWAAAIDPTKVRREPLAASWRTDGAIIRTLIRERRTRSSRTVRRTARRKRRAISRVIRRAHAYATGALRRS